MAINQNPSNMNRLFQTASQGQNQQQGTGYTNLNRLFQANKDNQLGQKVAGDIQNQVAGVQGQLKQQQEQFNKQAQQEASKFNEQERNAIIGRFSSADQAGGDVTDEDVNKVQTFRSGEYKGPQDLGDTSALSQQASGIAQQVSNFNPAGTQELLRRSVGGNRYTAGQSRLDSLLMDKSKLQPVARQASGLGQQLNQANVAAQGQAQTLKNQAQQFGQQTNEMLQSGLQNIDTGVQSQLKAAQDAEMKRQAAIQAVQDFARNKTNDLSFDAAAGESQVTDSLGNVVAVKDKYGNIKQKDLGRTTDAFSGMDQLKSLLAEKGYGQDEISKLFGTAESFAGAKSARDTELSQKNKDAEIKAFYDYYKGTQGASPVELMNYIGDPSSYGSSLAYKGALGGVQSTGANIVKDYSTMSPDSFYNKYSGKIQDLKTAKIAPTAVGGFRSQLSGLQDAAKSAADQAFYNQTGIAGKSALTGGQDNFYKLLADKIGQQSKAAQNLSDVGVASDAARKNYETLNKLLGKTTSEAKYRTDDTNRYQAGNLLINPDDLKNSL